MAGVLKRKCCNTGCGCWWRVRRCGCYDLPAEDLVFYWRCSWTRYILGGAFMFEDVCYYIDAGGAQYSEIPAGETNVEFPESEILALTWLADCEAPTGESACCHTPDERRTRNTRMR